MVNREVVFMGNTDKRDMEAWKRTAYYTFVMLMLMCAVALLEGMYIYWRGC